MKLNNTEYKELDKAFKTLLQERRPKSAVTLKRNVLRIVDAYNKYIFQLNEATQTVSDSLSFDAIKIRFDLIKSKLARVYELINCPLRVKEHFEPLDLQYFSEFSYSEIKMPETNQATMDTLAQILRALSLSQTSTVQLQTSRYELDIIQLVNQLTPTPFDGQKKDRVHFLAQCDILKARETSDVLKKLIFENIKGKLKGPALRSFC
ncbi:hypothetical protein ACFFRR_001083 [Megaselia abdita]